MKNFFIVRHAKSSWSELGLSDIERPLNKRGKHDAPKMAEYLKENLGVNIDYVIASPAVRAQKTAGYFYSQFQPTKALDTRRDIYFGDVDDYFEILKSLDSDIFNVLLVGHNPLITLFVNHYGKIDLENIPTCGVSHFETNAESWNDLTLENVNLLNIYLPKKLFY